MSGAKIGQRLRAELLSWPDVRDVYGPQLGKVNQFFLRFETADGETFAIELTVEGKDGD